jgi:hypothetical protein
LTAGLTAGLGIGAGEDDTLEMLIWYPKLETAFCRAAKLRAQSYSNLTANIQM